MVIIVIKIKKNVLYELYIKVSNKYNSLNIYKIFIRISRIIKEDIDLINIYELNIIIFNFIYEY